MIRRTIILGVLLAVTTSAWSQQTIVFPAVVDEVAGRNESLWVTVARIIKVDPGDTVTVRRKWVCLPDGGFLDDPSEAPTWTLDGSGDYARNQRILFKWGIDLFEGSDAVAGAVAFVVEGGRVLAHTVAHDVSLGIDLPPYYSFGQGQFMRALEEPLRGPSHLPWIGGCLNSPCARNPALEWDFLRNNIGIVNPNPEWLRVTGTVVPFKTDYGFPQEIKDSEPETFEKIVPPFGWLQFNWASSSFFGNDIWGKAIVPHAGFVINLTPDKDLPYYAYASVVFSPDPDSGIPIFNDPMFVPAEPGYVAPFAEVFPPPWN